MGQAKQRGTFEERQFKAKAERIKRGIDKMRSEREKEAALTQEQRAKRHRTRTMLALAMGLSSNIKIRGAL